MPFLRDIATTILLQVAVNPQTKKKQPASCFRPRCVTLIVVRHGVVTSFIDISLDLHVVLFFSGQLIVLPLACLCVQLLQIETEKLLDK